MADVTDALESVADSATRKVGPLPAWAWAGMAVAGVSAAILIRRRLSPTVGEPAEADDQADADTSTLDGQAGTGAGFLPGGFVVGGGPAAATGGTPADIGSPAPSAPKTNSDWQIDAQRFLIGRGYQGTIVTDALARFLSGRVLTPQGQAVIDAAIAGVGAPPSPVPPPTVSPTPEPVPSPGGGGTAPPPPPAPKPPAKVSTPADTSGDLVVTVAPGQTLYQLARPFAAGGNPMAAVRRIAKYNGITLGPPPNYVPSPWRAGQRVRIPGPNVRV